jgi:hypothetical protein
MSLLRGFYLIFLIICYNDFTPSEFCPTGCSSANVVHIESGYKWKSTKTSKNIAGKEEDYSRQRQMSTPILAEKV